jgi:tetratricopeptide (TPR) repeat protein
LNYLRIIEIALGENANPKLSYSAGAICLYHTGEFDKAIRYFQDAAAAAYQTNESLEGMAEAFYRNGDQSAALKTYQRLYDLGHRPFSVCNNLGNLLAKGGEARAALEVFKTSLKVIKKDAGTIARIRDNIRYLESTLSKAGSQPT